MTIIKLDDSWCHYSETCWDCANLESLSGHLCKIYGECPRKYWDDKESCPERIPTEEAEPAIGRK